MTPQETPEAKRAAFPPAMLDDCLGRVFRTRGVKAAGVAEGRRNPLLIKREQNLHHALPAGNLSKKKPHSPIYFPALLAPRLI
jgi:hypothetical protein